MDSKDGVYLGHLLCYIKIVLKQKEHYVVVAVVLIMLFFVFFFLARQIYNTDFPFYYRAGSIILDPKASNADLYFYNEREKYSIPEEISAEIIFTYGVPIAYFLAPFALLPYYTAKTAMILLNVFGYLYAISVILSFFNVSRRSYLYTILVFGLWPPFIYNLMLVNVNGLLFFLI